MEAAKPQRMVRMRDRVIGIDFSGAKDAGKKIWIATGIVSGGRLNLSECRQARDLFETVERDACLERLRRFISGQTDCAIGLDFPFGLPRSVVRSGTWEEFALSFRSHYSSPEEFRKACKTATKGSEGRRETDKEAQTPFSPYNLRLYRQTYHGICDVLAPLVRDRMACVLPMQAPSASLPWLLEICPASTLIRLGLRRPYKGRGYEQRAGRRIVLETLEAREIVAIEPTLRQTILNNDGGDALDSAIAAIAAAGALQRQVLPRGLHPDSRNVEGHIYF